MVLSGVGAGPPHQGVWRSGLPACHCAVAHRRRRNESGGIAVASSRQGRLLPPCSGTCGAAAAYARTSTADQVNSLPSAQILCRTTASFHATATFAFFRPALLARRTPQAFSADQRATRVSRVPAASKGYVL